MIDFTKYEEQRILIALYCINKCGVSGECTNECDAGDCLCLDEEQLSLLDQLLGVQISCEPKDGKTGFLKAKDYNEKIPFCARIQAGSKKLIKNFQIENKEIQDAISATVDKVEQEAWQEVLCGLPLIQMINIKSELSSRDSIAYWCLFGENTEEFVKKFLKALCACAIIRKIHGKDVKCVVDYAETIFSRISELYEEQEFNTCCEKLKQSIRQYEEKFREEKASLQIGYHSLRELFKNVRGVQYKRNCNKNVLTYILGDNESSLNEIVQLYRLIETVFTILGETLGKATKSFWNVKLENETAHSDYLKFQEVLCHINEKEEAIQEKIWQRFLFLLTETVECSAENVDAFCNEFLMKME